MNDSDELLPTMMRRATERLDQPDAAALVERGLRRGRQLKRRRTVGISLAAASAVVLAATGAFAAGKFLPTQDVQVATSPSATPTPTLPPAPDPNPTDWSKPTGTPEPDPEPETSNPSEEETLATLRALMPEGFKISEPKTWGSESYVGARITVNDGDGATELSVFISRASEAGLRCPVDPPAECQTLPDGSVVNSMKEVREYMEGHPSDLGVIYNSLTLERPDGLQVSLTNYNAKAEKRQPPTRKRPLFSVDELTELAKDARWQVTPPADGSMLPQR